MKMYSVTDSAFQPYGQVLTGYDYASLLKSLKELPIPGNGIVYQASVESLENDPVKADFQNEIRI